MTRASTRPGWKDLFTNAQLSRERPSCTVNAKQHICFSIALTDRPETVAAPPAELGMTRYEIPWIADLWGGCGESWREHP